MNITSGTIPHAIRLLCYGVEGIGKSTFVSKMPDPIYIDTENGTNDIDVKRFDKPTSWSMLLNEVQYVIDNPGICETLVIDSLDWAEKLCIEHILAKYQKCGLEEFGYGSGYRFVYEEFGRLLNMLTMVTDKGIHVGMTAHCTVRKIEQPDENGSYDRWTMKLIDSPKCSISAMVREYVDLLLFANYKVFVYATDDKGKKHKASGGQRVMYSNHGVCWDAKNRFGLPDEMAFDFSQVAHLFSPLKSQKAMEIKDEDIPTPAAPLEDKAQSAETPAEQTDPDEANIPPALRQLMDTDGIKPIEVKAAIAQRGYFPMSTKWISFPEDFVNGVLIGAWPQVKQMCLTNREEAPF